MIDDKTYDRFLQATRDALVLFRSTLALHGTPSSHAARMAVMFAARMAAEAGMTADEHATLAADEYALAKEAKEKP